MLSMDFQRHLGPSSFVTYFCYCRALVTFLCFFGIHNDLVKEPIGKARFWEDGDMSDTQVTLCPLEAGVKLEKNMGNILANRSDK